MQKERCGLLAKGRLLGVQFESAFEEPAGGGEALYWRLARNANDCALALRDGMVALGFEPYRHSDSNQQFFTVSAAQQQAFEEACGCETFFALPDGRKVIRFVCSWATQAEDVDELLALAAKLA